jgi:glycosyltransferase involved in cell wall biosynthesis
VTASGAAADTRERRVVMFVRNACTTDVRVLREAETLSRAGWATTIMALQPGGSKAPPDREERDGFEIIRVPYPSDWRKRWQGMRRYPWRWVRAVPGNALAAARSGPRGARRAVGLLTAGTIVLPYAAIQRVRFMAGHRPAARTIAQDDAWDHLAWWRYSVMGWARAAAQAAPAAEVYHGHDLTALPAAIDAARRHPGADVIYDSHELFLDAGIEARQPWFARRLLRRFERRLIRKVAAVITVNDSISERLQQRYGAPAATIVRNAPPRQPIRTARPDLLRPSAGIPTGAPVVLYHGGFQRDRGLEILAESMTDPRLSAAHLVLLGFGPLEASLRSLAAEPRFDGRIHVLPAVPPDELLERVASADVSAMPNQPRTENERLSTPNKLFESIAVGTPVVSSDFPERRVIVIDDPDGPLGAVCDPTRPDLVGGALADVISLPPDAMADLRTRCQRAAHERYNWETESARLLGVYDRLWEARAAR